MNKNISVGSVCSGIEAASVAWNDLGFTFDWFSEIAEFPSKVLKQKYPRVPNLGDMNSIAHRIRRGEAAAPDLICGGTPCQAFSLAGWKRGLDDSRGNLTLRFVDIIQASDEVRKLAGRPRSLVLWENVEGVLRDRTNAFRSFVSLLAGFETEVEIDKFPQAGFLEGPERNVAWRVLDAKYFGLPQQRRRLYVVAGGRHLRPERILFEPYAGVQTGDLYSEVSLSTVKDGVSLEVFRAYADCLYSAYGTKWNGNAAAYNGSLFVHHDNRLRRLTPLECERLMGFPDEYTKIEGWRPTNRYQATGNSWAIPVVRWIGKQIVNDHQLTQSSVSSEWDAAYASLMHEDHPIWLFEKHSLGGQGRKLINFTERPNNQSIGNILELLETKVDERYFITPVGCKGILRRRDERGMRINPRLEQVLERIAGQWSDEVIEKISRKQSRGRFSTPASPKSEPAAQLDIFDL